jgi:hypothetical protein
MQDRHGTGIAERAKRNDRLFLLGKAGAAETGDSLRQIIGLRRQSHR